MFVMPNRAVFHISRRTLIFRARVNLNELCPFPGLSSNNSDEITEFSQVRARFVKSRLEPWEGAARPAVIGRPVMGVCFDVLFRCRKLLFPVLFLFLPL